MGKHYLTTPIYYVNGEPHIGHAYTNIATDTLARFHRLQEGDADVQNDGENYDNNVFFLTGTDEHGEKVERAAEEAGETPKEFVDRVHVTFEELWDDLNLSNNDFIRTTDQDHQEAVQFFLEKLNENGDIEKGTFEGPYCVPCESFWNQDELTDGNCPECGREVENLSEETYYFKLTDYIEELKQHIEDNNKFIQPETRKNEVLKQIESENLEDLSITRARFDWGVTVPFDENHVTYVWFDALINYLTGIGFPNSDKMDWTKWWPADVHIIGKDILRFHALIWPCMLMALRDALDEANIDRPDTMLPKKVHAHGWWTIKGEKISKSKGNAVDPRELTDEYGRDAIRFFLLNQIPFGNDGTMSDQAIREVINGSLANDLGNLVSRVLGMIEKYRDGIVPEERSEDISNKFRNGIERSCSQFIEAMEELNFHRATQSLIAAVGHVNEQIQDIKPWKKDKNAPLLDQCLREMAEAINYLAYMCYPIMPETADEIWNRLDHNPNQHLDYDMNWYELEGGKQVSKRSALFPRMKISD